MAPTASRPRLTIFCHVHNEALLLPFWIRHHLRIFDHGVIVDRGSTDESVQIIRELAPTWDIVSSRNPIFDAVDCDREMMELESQYDGWKIILNATEFFFHDDLAGYLQEIERSDPSTIAVKVGMAPMIDPPELVEAQIDPEVDLWRQRHFGRLPSEGGLTASRFLHKSRNGDYNIGRHASNLPSRPAEELLILRYSWSPYSAVRARKLSIQAATAATDIARGMGYLHLCTPEQLDVQYAVEARRTYDLRDHEPFRSIYERMLVERDEPERIPVSTRSMGARTAPETPPVAVVGDTARSAEWREALDATAASTTTEIPRSTAIIVSPSMIEVSWLGGRLAPIIVDLCELPDPRALTAVPLYAPYRDPATPIALSDVLAAADYVVFASDEMRAVWLPLLIQAGRVDDSAGTEAMATIPAPLVSGAVDPVRKFLMDPVRRSVPVFQDRQINVSEASYRLTHSQMFRCIDDYHTVFAALRRNAATVTALQQQNEALAARLDELTRDDSTRPLRRGGIRRFRFPSVRRNRE